MKIQSLFIVLSLAGAVRVIAGPIHDAAKEGDLEKVKSLLAGDKNLLEAPDERGLRPLHHASSASLPVVEYLVGLKADVNAKSINGATPLYVAARSGQKEIAEFLLKNGADVNATGEGGPAINQAVYRGSADMVRLLLDYKADISLTDGDGNTALHSAAIWNAGEAAHMLLHAGANVNVKNKKGETPLHSCLEFAGEFGKGSLEVAQMLIGHGADLTIQNNNKRTPLAVAKEKNATEMVELLEKADH